MLHPSEGSPAFGRSQAVNSTKRSQGKHRAHTKVR